MAKKLFRTPTTLPEETQCRGLVIPASQEWLGLFSGALLESTHAWNYDQVESTDLTPEETAAKCYEIFTAWLDSECGGGGGPEECPAVALPTGQKIYRTSPTSGRWEVLDPVFGMTWAEPTGGESIPWPDPRPEETEALQKCGASSNVVNALHELYDSIVTFYNDEVTDLEAQAEVAAQIAVSIGSVFGPISATFLTLSGAAWEAFKLILAELTTDDWTPEFTEILTCIFEKHIELVDGVATWNVSSVAADLVGFLLPVIDEHVRVRWQVWYLMQCVGAQGLTAASAREDVDGDCATCDAWCVTLSPLDFGFTPTSPDTYFDSEGRLFHPNGSGWFYLNGELTVDTSQCEITRLSAVVSSDGSTQIALRLQASPSDGPLNQLWNGWGMTGFPIGFSTDDNIDWKSNSDETIVSVYMNNWESGRYLMVFSVTIQGTGINPFAVGSNC